MSQKAATAKARPDPAGPPDVIAEMRASYDRLTRSQKRIAEYVVEYPEAVAFATVDEMASALGSNPSTIVRFTYRLGLNGFPDLQARIQDRLRKRLATVGTGKDGGGSSTPLQGSQFESSLKHDLHNLYRTIEQLSAEDLEKAVKLLVEARRVYVCAALSSYAVAHFFTVILERLRSNTVLVGMDTNLAGSSLAEIRKEDCLLAFTFPPYARVTRQVARWVNNSGASVIAVTDSPISAVAQVADVVLLSACAGTGLQNSLVGPMAVANVVLNGVTAARGDAALERYQRLMGVLNLWNSFILK